ncbi:MAG: putative Ig domain-containing protein [Verrucomicrobiota bacterium]
MKSLLFTLLLLLAARVQADTNEAVSDVFGFDVRDTTGTTEAVSGIFSFDARDLGNVASAGSGSFVLDTTIMTTTLPAPTISGADPASYPATGGNRTLTLNGANFQNGATLLFVQPGGTPIPGSAAKLTVVSSGQISYQFNDGNLSGPWTVKVVNPDGKSAGTVSFTVTPVGSGPRIDSVIPDPVIGANSARTLTINGANFANKPTLTLTWPGQPGYRLPASSVSFLSSTQLQMSIVAGTAPGGWTVKASNPDNQPSNACGFQVSAPLPQITSLSPASAGAGSGALTLTVNGSTFHDGSIVLANGNRLTSTPHDSPGGLTTSLTATLPANYLAAAGNVTITVNSPGPGGGTSEGAAFAVSGAQATAPTISTSSLPTGTQNAAYSQTLAATGGTAPYTWSLCSGNLPSGMSLNSSGIISGTPTAATTTSFTVQVTGANTLSSRTVFTLTIGVTQTGGIIAGSSMRFDRNTYFTNYEANFGPFPPASAGTKRAGLDQLLTFIETDLALPQDSDFVHLRWAAYMLATTWWEAGVSYKPVPENWDLNYHTLRLDRPGHTATSKEDYFNYWYNGVNGNGDYASGDGYRYRGRGYVQITGRGNYALFGTDLVTSPDLALDPATAYRIMSYGMRKGAFTGKALDDYITSTETHYFDARWIVNGFDKKSFIPIADAATKFEATLWASRVSTGPSMSHTVTTIAGSNGSINSGTSLIVPTLGGVMFTATPSVVAIPKIPGDGASTYVVDQWLVNGIPAQSGGSNFTLLNVTADTDVQVTFKPAPALVYAVTPSAGDNGSISPSDALSVESGSDVTFAAAPIAGYVVDQWLVNDVVAQAGGTLFLLPAVAAPTTVAVTFKAAPADTYAITTEPVPSYGGTVTSGGAYTSESQQTVTATANPGYSFISWTENGIEVSSSATYSFVLDASRALVANFSATPFTVSDKDAPTLQITQPTSSGTFVTSANSVTLVGIASDLGHGNNGIATVTTNDVEATGDITANGGTANWSATIQLVPGANIISVVACDTSGNTSQQQMSVTYAPTALQSWRQTYFGSPDNSGDGADLNDFDHDGIVNLLEFAFGLDPTQNSAGMLPQARRIDNNFVISFSEPAGVNGIIYGAEWSETLEPGSWTEIDDTGISPQHTYSLPVDTRAKQYMRLKVTSP